VSENLIVYGFGGAALTLFGFFILLDAIGTIHAIPRKPGRSKSRQKRLDLVGKVVGTMIAVAGLFFLAIATLVSL
jgi:hypothetical protein